VGEHSHKQAFDEDKIKDRKKAFDEFA
jgi:hypothetical protein